MTSQAMSDIPAARPAKAIAYSPFLLFCWSVRRELWEHRAVLVAPTVVAALALIGFLFGAIHLAPAVSMLMSFHMDHAAAALISLPYAFVCFAVVMTGLIVSIFYCVSALHNERRDRSILFWKSLPVSNLTTVLSKAAIPMIVVPPVTFVVAVAAQLIMAGLSAVIVLFSGLPLEAWWAHVPLIDTWRTLAEGLPFIAIWYAPLFAWLILVSGWARRAPFLWALSPLVLALVERLALGTSYVGGWLKLRLIGAFLGAMSDTGPGFAPTHKVAGLDPIEWTSPHVWTGLVLAAIFLGATVWLRRTRDPI